MAKYLSIVALVAGTLLVSAPAIASSQSDGSVDMLAVDNLGGPYAFWAVGGTRTTKPACATDDLWTISNPSSDIAKALYATVMTAYSLGRHVTVVSTGVCVTNAPTRETVAAWINAL